MKYTIQCGRCHSLIEYDLPEDYQAESSWSDNLKFWGFKVICPDCSMKIISPLSGKQAQKICQEQELKLMIDKTPIPKAFEY